MPELLPVVEALTACDFFRGGGRREVRTFHTSGRVTSVLVSSAAEAAAMVPADYRHAFLGLNRVRDDVTGSVSATAIERRCLLLADYDPVRPVGTNSTEGELLAAYSVAANTLQAMTTLHNWPRGFLAWSGNGVHLVYHIDLPNDEASTKLIRAVLQRFASDFGTDAVKVDTAVFDAPRIVRLWGTVNRKGDAPTEERPHRMSGALPNQTGPYDVVPVELLQAYAREHLLVGHQVGAAHQQPSIAWLDLADEQRERIVVELRGALTYLDADDRATWVSAGQALRSLGEVGFELWSEWSATSIRYPGGHGLDQWNTFKGDRTGFPAIFERAQQQGWKNPRALDTTRLGFGGDLQSSGGQHQTVPRVLLPYGDVRDGTDRTLPLTQYGNAQRLLKIVSRSDGVPLLRHVYEKRAWIKWMADAWCHSDASEVRDLALSQLPKLIYEEGSMFLAKDFKPFADFARKASEGHHAAGAVDILGGMPGVRIKASELDADPWVVGLDSGRVLLDLRTGQVRPATPEDRITRWLNVASLGEVARAVRWCQFVSEVLCHDRELIDFLHRFCGYALTGLTTEQFFLFLFGHGANGKSVFTEVLRDLFGGYAVAVQPATLCDDKRTAAAASPDLARLDGMRLAIAPEAEAASSLAESLVKGLIAGDVMPVRVPYGMPFDMRPVLKLVMTGNHKPRISGTDRGIWRRVRLVPFMASFEDRADPDLLDKLKAEKPHIAAWLVAGCLEWQRRGLRDTPRVIVEATEEYRAEEDLLGQWLEEAAERAPAAEVRASLLYSSFTQWAARSGIQRPWTASAFGKRLSEYRVNDWHIGERKGTGGVRLRTGIRLRPSFGSNPFAV